MNLLMANKSQYANYVPGYFPDNIASVKYPSATTFSITFKQAYSSNWLFLNQLSLIFALPQHAWDKTSVNRQDRQLRPHDGGREGRVQLPERRRPRTCRPTPTNPLWQVVDGPFQISRATSPTAKSRMVPNKGYSGPVKPKVAKVAVPELHQRRGGVQPAAVRQPRLRLRAVQRRAVGARLKSAGLLDRAVGRRPGMNYAVFNYTNPTTGPLFSQLYIRQAHPAPRRPARR